MKRGPPRAEDLLSPGPRWELPPGLDSAPIQPEGGRALLVRTRGTQTWRSLAASRGRASAGGRGEDGTPHLTCPCCLWSRTHRSSSVSFAATTMWQRRCTETAPGSTSQGYVRATASGWSEEAAGPRSQGGSPARTGWGDEHEGAPGEEGLVSSGDPSKALGDAKM